MSYDYLFKLIVIGEPYVGKSALVERLCDRPFKSFYEVTIGVEFESKTTQMDDKIIKSHIWDTAGQEQFASIVATYFRDCAGAFLVYDVENDRSFERLDHWRNQLSSYNEGRGVPVVLIANKCESSSRVVSTEEGEKYAIKHNMKYIETSAKNNINIKNFFKLLLREIYTTMDKNALGPGVKKGLLPDLALEPIGENASSKLCCLIS
jgi:small GTP-binding protein